MNFISLIHCPALPQDELPRTGLNGGALTRFHFCMPCGTLWCLLQYCVSARLGPTCLYLMTFFVETLHRDIHDSVYYPIAAWICFLYYWPFVRGIHWSPVDSPHKGPVMQVLCVSQAGSHMSLFDGFLHGNGSHGYSWFFLFWWFSARLQYLLCISNGDTAVLH